MNPKHGEAIALRPGMKLVVRVDPDSQPDELDAIKSQLGERLPGVEVLLLAVDQLVVYAPLEVEA